MSKFTINPKFDHSTFDGTPEDVEAFPRITFEPDNGSLKVSIADQQQYLSPKEAKALAKYLNSWAGFEEASRPEENLYSPVININGNVTAEQIEKVLAKAARFPK